VPPKRGRGRMRRRNTDGIPPGITRGIEYGIKVIPPCIPLQFQEPKTCELAEGFGLLFAGFLYLKKDILD
jgi:hypothetical protein